jgi:hypothetical protein
MRRGITVVRASQQIRWRTLYNLCSRRDWRSGGMNLRGATASTAARLGTSAFSYSEEFP